MLKDSLIQIRFVSLQRNPVTNDEHRLFKIQL
jgi:hypothetical protein